MQEHIEKAVEILTLGDVVVMPTETVYGLAADATNSSAVAKIYALKDRPQFNPLIIHVCDMEMAKRFGVFNDTALKLAQHFWAGALTVVVPIQKNCGLSPLVTAGLETVGIRIPNHQKAIDLIRKFGKPLAAPSANASGKVSPVTANHVRLSLQEKTPYILPNEMPCQIGLESTIIDCTSEIPVLLRWGGLSITDIEAVLGQKLQQKTEVKQGETPSSPGQLLRHYAPDAVMRLNATDWQGEDGLMTFGTPFSNKANHVFDLSLDGDLNQAASNLFTALHFMNEKQVKKIAVMPIPEQGLGLAINDRLKRACQK